MRRLLEKSKITRKHVPFYFRVALLIWAILFVITLFNYLVARRDFLIPPPQFWLDNILAKCNMTYSENRWFLNPGFIKLGLVSSPFGAYLGILYDSYYSRTNTLVTINKTPLKYSFLRLLFGFLMVIPLMLPYIIMREENFNMYFLYFFKTSLPFFLITFFLFGISKEIFRKYKI